MPADSPVRFAALLPGAARFQSWRHLACLVVAVTTWNAHGLVASEIVRRQETAVAPEANEVPPGTPKLELLVEDDFSVDSRDKYRRGGEPGDLNWRPGLLQIGPNASIDIDVAPSPWIELEFDWQPISSDVAALNPELRVHVSFSGGGRGYLKLKREPTETDVVTGIGSFAWFRLEQAEGGIGLMRKAAEVPVPGGLPKGRWRMAGRYGVWTCGPAEGDAELLTLGGSSREVITSIRFESRQGANGLAGVRLRAAHAPENDLPADALARLEEANRMAAEVVRLMAEGKTSDGLALSRRVRDIRLELLGAGHPEHARSLNSLVVVHQIRGEAAEALPLAREALEIRRRALGDRHPDYAQSLQNLSRLLHDQDQLIEALACAQEAHLIQLDTLGRDHPDTILTQENIAILLNDGGDFPAAEQICREALAARERSAGKNDAGYARSLACLAKVLRQQGKLAEAASSLEQARDIFAEAGPAERTNHVDAIAGLATLCREQGDYAAAEELHLEVLELRAEHPGKTHFSYAHALNDYAIFLVNQGRFAEAMPFQEQACALHVRCFGEEHTESARSSGNLAMLHYHLGNDAEAERLYRKSLDIQERLVGKLHVDYLRTLNNFVLLKERQGDLATAESLQREIAAQREKTLGKEHPHTAQALHNLAGILARLGRLEEAAACYLQTLGIQERTLGKDQPGYALSLCGLSNVRRAQGDQAAAESLLREALDIQARVLGTKHFDYATSLCRLALLCQLRGDNGAAAGLLDEALGLLIGQLDATAAVQSEMRQLSTLGEAGDCLRSLIACEVAAPRDRASVHSRALRWKGMAFVRQRMMRLGAESGDPQLAQLLNELRTVATRQATETLAVPTDRDQLPAWRERLAGLDSAREAIEVRLSGASADFRQLRGRAALDSRAMAGSLPAGTALVDMYEYSRPVAAADGKGPVANETACCAFVLRNGKEIELVELGSRQEIDELVSAWRTGLMEGDANAGGSGALLRRLLWEPLVPHLGGAVTVLVSPVGSTALIPWNALPGSRDGTFLIEEQSLSTLPIPQLLGDYLNGSAAVENGGPGLLLLADVDFGAAPETADGVPTAPESAHASASRPRFLFEPLAGSRPEALAIRDSFEVRFPNGNVTWLRGEAASEERFVAEASRHRFLHLATHGFFASPEVTSSLASTQPERPIQVRLAETRSAPRVVSLHPGLLSGLAFAGVNQPRAAESADGVLTALEAGVLDLSRVELVTLSACETGLGLAAGGEGLLGLQRAFQVAGARSTVGSLWKVDDQSSQALMAAFYDGLWNRKLGKLEALRAAQLAMLREQKSRGGEDVVAGAENAAVDPRLWAAWVLSGDWR